MCLPVYDGASTQYPVGGDSIIHWEAHICILFCVLCHIPLPKVGCPTGDSIIHREAHICIMDCVFVLCIVYCVTSYFGNVASQCMMEPPHNIRWEETPSYTGRHIFIFMFCVLCHIPLLKVGCPTGDCIIHWGATFEEI